MGFLAEGNTLGFEDTKAKHHEEEEVVKTRIDARSIVKRDGLKQLVSILRDESNKRDYETLLWGDEVEMTCVALPKCMNNPPKLWMGGYGLVEKLQKLEEDTNNEWKDLCQNGGDSDQPEHSHLELLSIGSAWHPEMSRHMVEALPNPPFEFSGRLDGIVDGIEESMNARRRKIQCMVPEDVVATTITAFPGMGGFEPGITEGWWATADSDEKIEKASPLSTTPASRSRFIPDSIANPHPRFPTLVENIRKRRGGSYKILVPVYQDENTQDHPMWTLSLPEDAATNRSLVDHAAMLTPNPIKDHIYMDSFAFGMGTSCLQVTVGTKNKRDARYLYDQYTVLAPLILALTASTPAYRGLLADTDTRWSTLEQGCDCRTAEEEDPKSPNHIPKSRYSAVSLYIGLDDDLYENFDGILNDSNAPLNKEAHEYLLEEGVEPQLARHYGHLWIRQPMVIYDNALFLDNSTRNDHFENLNSTNWNSVRFKPPAPGEDHMPYRVELRTAEIQLTDFENACVASFSTMFARACLDERWELYLPMTLNDENMRRSWNRDAVVAEKFWFRRNLAPGSTAAALKNKEDLFVEMTMHEIMSGCRENNWPGLMALVMRYVNAGAQKGLIRGPAIKKFAVYCEFLKARASGEIPTCARYLRNLMTSHLHYAKDSVITPSMAARAMSAAALVGAGVFTNSTSSAKPHLGRFVLDVKPIYSRDCNKHSCCILTELRESMSEYEAPHMTSNVSGSCPDIPKIRLPPLPSKGHSVELCPSSDGDETTDLTPNKLLRSLSNRSRLEGLIDAAENVDIDRDLNRSGFYEQSDVHNHADKCTIHGTTVDFHPVSECGGYKSPHYEEWTSRHVSSSADDSDCCRGYDITCHNVMNAMLQHGADLSKLQRAGFPCFYGTTKDASPDQKTSYTKIHGAKEGDIFMMGAEEKNSLWKSHIEELQHPESTPKWKQTRNREILDNRLKIL